MGIRVDGGGGKSILFLKQFSISTIQHQSRPSSITELKRSINIYPKSWPALNDYFNSVVVFECAFLDIVALELGRVYTQDNVCMSSEYTAAHHVRNYPTKHTQMHAAVLTFVHDREVIVLCGVRQQ